MRSTVNHVILVIVDDVRASHLFGWMDAGKMPNLSRLADGGLTCRRCVTTFPSITLPTQPNIMTGAYSGYYPKEGSGIPTYHWVAREDPPANPGDPLPFIRNYGAGTQAFKMNEDLGNNVATIFEQAGEGNHLSVLQFCHRGAKIFPRSMVTVVLGYLWFMGIRRNPAGVDPLVLKVVERAFLKPRKFFDDGEPPRVAVAYIPGTDHLMHEHGFDHRKYVDEVLRCDRYLGRLLDALDRAGYSDDVAVALVTDHGNYKAAAVEDLAPFFASRGLRPYDPSPKSVRKRGGPGDFDCTFGSLGFFNFPGDGGDWHRHPTEEQLRRFEPSGTGASQLDLLDAIWAINDVEVVFRPDDENAPDRGVVHVERRVRRGPGEEPRVLTGRVTFEGHGAAQRAKYEWDGDRDDDPLGYHALGDDNPATSGQFLDVDGWLAATVDSEFPFVVDQLPRYFKNPRACDVLASTRGRRAFNYEHGRTMNDHAYSHDLSVPSSMFVPLVIGGSDAVPHVELPLAKTVDLVPTLLALLGVKPGDGVVGRSLLG